MSAALSSTHLLTLWSVRFRACLCFRSLSPRSRSFWLLQCLRRSVPVPAGLLAKFGPTGVVDHVLSCAASLCPPCPAWRAYAHRLGHRNWCQLNTSGNRCCSGTTGGSASLTFRSSSNGCERIRSMVCSILLARIRKVSGETLWHNRVAAWVAKAAAWACLGIDKLLPSQEAVRQQEVQEPEASGRRSGSW